MSETFNFPTETVELPSKGLIYPEDHPLRSGKVEIKYMTAKEEDILTNQNLIEKGTVLEKLLEALTMNKFDLKDIHTGDKNAIFVAARVLGYGKNYSFGYGGEEYTVDLSKMENKPFNDSIVDENGIGKFEFPNSDNTIQFKFLTEKDEEKIDEEIKGMKKIISGFSGEVTTRLKHQIVSINENTDKNEIKNFVDNYLLAQDSRAFRLFLKEHSPNIDLVFEDKNGEKHEIPISLNFFYPDL